MSVLFESQLEIPANLQALAQQSYDQFMTKPGSGFVDVVLRDEMWKSCASTAESLNTQYQKVFWIGVGGSVLGAQVLAEVFAINDVDFCDTIDPLALEDLIERSGVAYNLSHTLFVIASKSGSTIESLAAWDHLLERFTLIK